MMKPYFKRIKHNLIGIDKTDNFNSISIYKDKELIVKDFDFKYISDNKDNILGFPEYFYNELKEGFNKGYVIKEDTNVKLILDFSNLDSFIGYNIFEVMENTTLNLTLIIQGNNFKYANTFLKLIGRKNSKINLTTVNLLPNKGENLLNISTDLYENSNYNYYSIEFGASVNLVSLRTNLLENNVNANMIPVYFSDSNKKMDLEYTLKFYGKNCNGIIDARGVTKDTSRKVFRGNLIFEKGSTKSNGSEQEFSIILSKTCNAQSIPTLFCKEDDVIGAHAANIGKINEDKLYYLMSRGLSEKASKKLVVLSSISPVLEVLNDENLIESIEKEIDDRI